MQPVSDESVRFTGEGNGTTCALPGLARRAVRWARGLLVAGVLVSSARAQLLRSSPERDLEQGEEMAKMVEREIGLYAAPKTEAYVRELGERLVAIVGDSRWKFSFQVVDQAEPNAFAIPGGGIYVSRGLLALIQSEDELAGVLAHEIAHVTQRHSARQERRGILPGVLSLPGKVVGSVVGENLGALVNAPVEAVGGAWMSRYSRGQESEADRLGLRTVARAGYQPDGLADILVRLERDVASQTGQERRFGIFDSHPMTETRKRDIGRQSAELRPAAGAPIAADATAVFSRIEGLWWGENPENGVFRRDQFLHAATGFTVTFPQGWKHRNTPRYVLSSQPDGEALLLLGVAGPTSDPEVTGGKFVARMRAEAGAEPVSVRRMAAGEFPAFVATYVQRSGRAPVYMHFAWAAMGRFTYQLVAMGPDTYRATLRDAALSLRPLTDVERGTVTGRRLRVVAARAGERLEDLGARTGNVWSPSYTALANALPPDAVLAEGRPVKIARLEPVQP